MTSDEIDEWRAQRDITLWKEALDVEGIFQFCVEAATRVFMCQSYTATHCGERTHLVLNDVWVNDALASQRLVPKVEIMTSDYYITTMRNSE